MNAWIISIVGVICLGILLEIVLPEGQTAKYVKGAFSLLVIFVIVAPLPALFSKDWTVQLDDSYLDIDAGFIAGTYADYEEGIESALEEYLASCGYQADVDIIMRADTPTLPERINVKIKGDCDKSEILSLIRGRLNVSEDIIYVS